MVTASVFSICLQQGLQGFGLHGTQHHFFFVFRLEAADVGLQHFDEGIQAGQQCQVAPDIGCVQDGEVQILVSSR